MSSLILLCGLITLALVLRLARASARPRDRLVMMAALPGILVACAVPALAQDVATSLPSVAELCAAVANPSGLMNLLDGTMKGVWTFVGAVLLISSRWILPAVLHWFRQRFLGSVSKSEAGAIVAGVITGTVTNIPAAIEQKVASAKERAGETFQKVGATDATIKARIEGDLGELVAAAPPEVVTKVLQTGASLLTGLPKPANQGG